MEKTNVLIWPDLNGIITFEKIGPLFLFQKFLLTFNSDTWFGWPANTLQFFGASFEKVDEINYKTILRFDCRSSKYQLVFTKKDDNVLTYEQEKFELYPSTNFDELGLTLEDWIKPSFST